MGAHDNEFRWNFWNRHQVEKHGLTPREVEFVVRLAKHPYPRRYKRKNGWEVRGQIPTGELVKVLYFIEDDLIYVYHAQ
jgi:hypothetical protein